MLCYAMLCYAMLGYAMLCYAVLTLYLYFSLSLSLSLFVSLSVCLSSLSLLPISLSLCLCALCLLFDAHARATKTHARVTKIPTHPAGELIAAQKFHSLKKYTHTHTRCVCVRRVCVSKRVCVSEVNNINQLTYLPTYLPWLFPVPTWQLCDVRCTVKSTDAIGVWCCNV